jgi:hypothetical protein
MALTVPYDPGLAASPGVWHTLEVERGGRHTPRSLSARPPRKRRRAKIGDTSAQSVSRHAVMQLDGREVEQKL